MQGINIINLTEELSPSEIPQAVEDITQSVFESDIIENYLKGKSSPTKFLNQIEALKEFEVNRYRDEFDPSYAYQE